VTLSVTGGVHAQIGTGSAPGRTKSAPAFKDAQKIVDAIFDEVTAALARGDRIELRGFGAFFLRTRSARPGRNPRNGTSVSVPEKLHPSFKVGKEKHHRLNGTMGSDLRAAFHKVSSD
jgi:integration host factor subunit beta